MALANSLVNRLSYDASMFRIPSVLLIVLMAFSCSGKSSRVSDTTESDASAHLAHEAYVEAINSNNLDQLLGMLTDDVVFLAPNEAVMIGKESVKPWLEGYLAAFKTHWDKPVHEFVVNGEWAFERYSYHSTDTLLETGEVFEGTGWGLVIYHHDEDGKWRVARDAWGSDQPQ
jgi:ketosteroid isomerase-like protein